MNISDEQLMTYADGEGDSELRQEVEQALARDPQLVTRLRQHQALRQRLSSAYEHALSEPIPDRLLAALQPGQQPDSKIVPFKPRQPSRRTRPWPQWTAMAASLIVGVLIGLFAVNQRNGSLVVAEQNQLVARGRLADALDTQPAGAQQGSAGIQMNVSFKNHAGEYCRTFMAQEQALAGLACHTQDAWQLRELSTSLKSNDASAYRQAGSAMPATVLTAVDQQISGDPLDAAAESQAIESHWQPSGKSAPQTSQP